MKFLSDILAKAGLVVDGVVTLNSVTGATTDTDKFVVIDNGVVKFRTGAQLLSDIGALSSESDTLQSVTTRGNITSNAIAVGAITTSGNIFSSDGALAFYPSLSYYEFGNTVGNVYSPIVVMKNYYTGSEWAWYAGDPTYTGVLLYKQSASSAEAIYWDLGREVLPYNSKIVWGAGVGNLAQVTTDIGLARDSANVLQVNNGNIGSYATIKALSFVRHNGTSAQFLKADGSVDTNTYLTSFTETDPTVPSHVKAITTTNIGNWNTAFAWGNHAGLYYTLGSTVANSTQWNGLSISLSTYVSGTVPSALVYNSTNSRVEFGTWAQYQTWLGLGSAAYTPTTNYGRAYSSDYSFYGSNTAISTADFVSLLSGLGAFSQPYWVARGSWCYACNGYITDSGHGVIPLAGSVVEVIGNSTNYTIRVTAPTTSNNGGQNREFIYVKNSEGYAPGWRVALNNTNYTDYAVPTSGYTFGSVFSLGTMYVSTGEQYTPSFLLGVYSNGYAYKFPVAGIQSWLGMSDYLLRGGGTMTGKIFTASFGSDTYGGALEIRERGYVIDTQSDWSYSPAISFHWGNRFAVRLGFRWDGQLAVDNVPYLNANNYSSYAVPISGGVNMTGSYGLNDAKLYLRTNGDNNHYLWNASDDWEELNAYEGTGFRIVSNTGTTGLLYVYGTNLGGYTYSPYSFRAPVFYDSQNTGYYLVPRSGSVLLNLGLGGVYPDVRLSIAGDGHISGYLYMGGTAGSAGSWGTRTSSNVGVWTTNAYGFRLDRTGYGGNVIFYSDESERIGLRTTDFSWTVSDNTAAVGSISNNRVYVDGSIQLLGNNDAIVFGRGTGSFLKDEELGFGWGGGWYMVDGTYNRSRNDKIVYTGSYFLAGGSMRAPIFYDSDDTAFYADFASGTNIRYLNINGTWGSSPFSSGHAQLNITGSYPSITMRQTDNSQTYTLLHTADAFYMYVGRGATNGTDWNWGLKVLANQDGNWAEARTSFRAPIFYDSQDTGFYVDPNSTSVLQYLTLNAAESLGLYGARGKYSGEYMHLYRKVGVGNPSGWGTGEGNTPDFGLSTYGGATFGYGNGAGITVSGTSNLNGSIVQSSNIARPLVRWAATSAAGPVVIKLPGGSGNYGMVHMVIDIYEYNGNNVCTIIVGGHNWASYWVNYGADVIGYTNKQVRLGFKDGQYCVVIGDSGSTWEYGSVVLRKIHNSEVYNTVMNLGGTYTIGIESDSYSWISGDLRQLRVPGNLQVGNGAASNIIMVDQDEGNRIIHCNSNRIGFLNQSGSWSAWSDDSGTFGSDYQIYSNSSMRSPIYYDANNSGYYADFDATTSLRTAGSWRSDSGAWDGEFNGKIQYHADAWYFQASNAWNFRNGAGSNIVSINNAGDLTASSSLRAPIFYDSNDTTYYADFNSTSDAAIRLRGGILMGPNPTWGAYLQVGGNGRNNSSAASVVATSGNLHLDAANGYNTYLNYYSGGTIYLGTNTAYYITSSGDYYTGTSASSNALNGWAYTSYIYKSGGTGYYQADNWIQINASTGLYWPAYYDAHLLPNVSGSHGSLEIRGTKGGWYGLYFYSGATLMMNSSETGVYGQGYGWQWRWYQGTMYINRSTYGGSTEFTVVDTGNFRSHLDGTYFHNIGFTGGGSDANTLAENRSAFTYAVNAPHSGPIAYFGASGYGLQLNANYGNGASISYRVRNGDNATWSSWREFIHTGNIGSQTVAYASSETLATVTGRGSSSAGSITVNGWVYTNGSTGMFFNNSGNGVWSPESEGNPYGNIATYGPGRGGWKGYGIASSFTLMGRSSVDVGMHDNGGGGWIWYSTYGTGCIALGGASPQSGYRVTINGGGASLYTSGYIYSATDIYANNYFRMEGNYGYSLIGLYNSTRFQGIYAMGSSYLLSSDGTTPGNLYGLSWAHPNAGGQAGNLSSHGLLVMQNGVTMAAISTNIWASGNIIAYSDERVKDQIELIEDPLDKIKELRGVTYVRTDINDPYKKWTGVIAQDVLRVLPEAVEGSYDNGYSVAYGNMVGLLIEAIKELTQKIEKLEQGK